jgi:hypothetical protein
MLIAWRQRAFLRGAKRYGPAVVGLIRPRIHLPADFEERFSAAERDLILAHERSHVARQDARVNGVLALVQCAFWFNPAVHLGAGLARQDQEMACDEMVIARYPGARKPYAEALLKTQIAPAALPLGCYWPSRASLPLERRIRMLKTPVRGRTRRWAGGLAVALLAASGGYAAWAAQPARIVLVASVTGRLVPEVARALHKPKPAARHAHRSNPASASVSAVQTDPVTAAAPIAVPESPAATPLAAAPTSTAQDVQMAALAPRDVHPAAALGDIRPPASDTHPMEAPGQTDSPPRPDRIRPAPQRIPIVERHSDLLNLSDVFHSILSYGDTFQPF